MDRRKALLLVAAVIAAVGTLLVFLYVRGADTRADQRYDAVQVLRVVKPIAAGETVEAAQSAGKIESGSVSKKDLLPDALTGTQPIAGKVAVTNIYPGEQLISSKFGATGSANGLAIPKGKIAISINLSDPSRVAGFVNPGDKVAIFMNSGTFTRLLGHPGPQGPPLHHPRPPPPPAPAERSGDRGRHHYGHHHHDDRLGRREEHRAAVQDPAHPGGRAARGREGALREPERRARLR